MKALRSKIDGSIFPFTPELSVRGDLEEIPHPCMTIDQEDVVNGVVVKKSAKPTANARGE